MRKCSGKSNLDIVRSYLSGERPFVQVGYNPDMAVERKEGEVWDDAQGSQWVFKNGYKQRLAKKSTISNQQRCKKCNADVRWGSHLDAKIWPKTGRCYDCNVEFETRLTIRGEFDKYEKFKVLNNKKSVLRDFLAKLDESIAYLEPQIKKSDDKQIYINEDGSHDAWSGDLGAKRKILADLKWDKRKIGKELVKTLDELAAVDYTGEL